MRSFKVICVFFLINIFISHIGAQTKILGCGGFVKSHASIDFSKIEVKL